MRAISKISEWPSNYHDHPWMRTLLCSYYNSESNGPSLGSILHIPAGVDSCERRPDHKTTRQNTL